MLGSVNHQDYWRDPVTGVHSNDAESEWARLKLFLRTKYSYARASNNTNEFAQDASIELKIAEYVYYTNVGRTMDAVMKAFAYNANSSGQAFVFP